MGTKLSQNKMLWPTFFLILFILQFYRPIFLKDIWSHFNSFKYALLMMPLPFILCKGAYWRQKYAFKKVFVCCFIFMVLNIITCYLYRNQSIFVSMGEWTTLFFICFYPTFVSWKRGTHFWEKIILLLYILFLVIFALQFLSRDKFELFYLDNSFAGFSKEDRLRLYSDGILYLGSLFSLNKYLCNGNKKFLILFFLGLLGIFIEGYRMLIICYIPILLFMLYKLHKSKKNLLFFIIISCGAIGYLYQTSFGQDKINQMINRNQKDNFDNGDYVRVLLVDYYYSDHFKNYLEMFLGSGMPQITLNPSTTKSQYSKECSENAILYHYYPVDMGLIGLSWNAGIPFTVSFIILMLSVIRMKIPKEYYYLCFWEIYIVLVGTTNELSYYHSNVIYQSIALTIISSFQITKGNNKIHNEKQN